MSAAPDGRTAAGREGPDRPRKARRIALIHALRHSPPPIEAAFARLWPGQVLMNLLDDSLSADLAREGRLTPAMTDRFLALAATQGHGAEAILSLLGLRPPIEACARDLAPCRCSSPRGDDRGSRHQRKRIGLVTSRAPSVDDAGNPAGITVVRRWRGRPRALDGGDVATHDRQAAEAARDLADLRCLRARQFSRAGEAAGGTATGKPVLTRRTARC